QRWTASARQMVHEVQWLAHQRPDTLGLLLPHGVLLERPGALRLSEETESKTSPTRASLPPRALSALENAMRLLVKPVRKASPVTQGLPLQVVGTRSPEIV